MNVYDRANELAGALRQSEEATEYRRLKELAEADETNRALLGEYRKLQVALQMQAMGGPKTDDDAMQRFSQISSLLYMNSDVQAYLMAEMRLQKLMADIFKVVAEAGGLNMDMLGA